MEGYVHARALGLIVPSQFNVKQEIDADSLTYSIDSVGPIEPLRVRLVSEGFEIRTWMRRFLAIKAAGATYADVIVVEGDDEKKLSRLQATLDDFDSPSKGETGRPPLIGHQRSDDVSGRGRRKQCE